eukprot:scaffold5659_cov121-Isochrysis_galbana.AAC.5
MSAPRRRLLPLGQQVGPSAAKTTGGRAQLEHAERVAVLLAVPAAKAVQVLPPQRAGVCKDGRRAVHVGRRAPLDRAERARVGITAVPAGGRLADPRRGDGQQRKRVLPRRSASGLLQPAACARRVLQRMLALRVTAGDRLEKLHEHVIRQGVQRALHRIGVCHEADPVYLSI